ncbi:hypothetical protein YPPY64_0954, partial [Yersinia pestis PY-64]|jgi:hypothetical protein
MAGL